MATKLEAIVLWFERKISLHSKSRGGGGLEAEEVLWNGSLGLSMSCSPTSDANNLFCSFCIMHNVAIKLKKSCIELHIFWNFSYLNKSLILFLVQFIFRFFRESLSGGH